jgi:hypothetical protein
MGGLNFRLGRRTRIHSPQGSVVLKRQFQLIGAGEEIRTLDPNLGKVVLYH